MEFRKLSPAEHGRTRTLYEEVFPEDEAAFVDYYYEWKIRDNIIYAAEDESGIHAMVHLNPFRLWIQGKTRLVHYIVAVATEKEYRHRGLMRKLLELAEQDMQAAGEAFTFLMPASEQIYLPFGYRFFCSQRQGIWLARIQNGKREQAGLAANPASVICRPVRPQDYDALADFVNRVLSAKYQVFVYRDREYYERSCQEQQCQDGAVMMLVRLTESREEVIGTFCRATEHGPSGDRMELREIILDDENVEAARDRKSVV